MDNTKDLKDMSDEELIDWIQETLNDVKINISIRIMLNTACVIAREQIAKNKVLRTTIKERGIVL